MINFLTGIVSFIIVIGLIKPKLVLFFLKNPSRIKVLLLWGLVLAGLLYINPNKPETPSTNTSGTVESSDPRIDYGVGKSKLNVRYEQQGLINGMMKLVVWVKNESDYLVNGDLQIRVFDENSKRLSSITDVMFVENLSPTDETYAIFKIKPTLGKIKFDYEWSGLEFAIDKTDSKYLTDSPYKFLKDTSDRGNKLEFFLSEDRDFQKMYDFIKNRKVNPGVFYHCVFVDDENFARFSKYPITAMTFDDDVTRHIIAQYGYNTTNGYKNFTYYQKNKSESVPKTLE